jgi:hypothetical protein
MTCYDKVFGKSVVIRREMDQFPREARVKDVLKTIFLSKVVFSGEKKKSDSYQESSEEEDIMFFHDGKRLNIKKIVSCRNNTGD